MSQSGNSMDSGFSLRLTSSDSGLTMSDNVGDFDAMKEAVFEALQTPEGARALEHWYKSPEPNRAQRSPQSAWTHDPVTGSPWQLAGALSCATSVTKPPGSA